jgi:nucleotide-binding universal stress UspA family protein
MYPRILVFLADEALCRPAVDEAVALARIHGSELAFACVLPNYAIPLADMPMATVPLPDEFQQAAQRNAEQMMASAMARAKEAGVACRQEIVQGPEDEQTVLELAQRLGCGLIVVASSGHNAIVRLLSGSVIPGLITQSTIPLLIVRGATATATTTAEPAPAHMA